MGNLSKKLGGRIQNGKPEEKWGGGQNRKPVQKWGGDTK